MSFGGAGSVMDMIVRYRNNMNMLRKKSLFKKKSSLFEDAAQQTSGIQRPLHFKRASPEQLISLRRRLQKERKRNRLLTILFVFIILSATLYGAFHLLPSGKSAAEVAWQRENDQKRHDLYLYYLQDGDHWLSKRNWFNAVYQYKKAAEVYPGEFDALFRLAMAYTYQCEAEDENCEKAQALVERLIKVQPQNTKLLSLQRDCKGMERK